MADLPVFYVILAAYSLTRFISTSKMLNKSAASRWTPVKRES